MKNLLIVEAGFKTHKEFIIKKIKETGLVNLYFACGLDSIIDYKWLDKYGKRIINFSYLNNDELYNKTLEYQRKSNIKFDGVVTWVETSVHRVNQLQHQLGLPIISEFNDKSIRNKGLTRLRLAEADADNVKFHILKSTNDLLPLKNQSLEYPRILKPTEMMASLGVTKITSLKNAEKILPKVLNVDFIDENLRELYGDIEREAIMEELLVGDGYSIECVTVNGITRVIGYNKKITQVFYDLGNILNPKELSQEFKDKIDEKMSRIHKAMKIQFGITHVELRIVNNEPKILEINYRLGGDYIPQMIHQKAKLNLGKLIIDTYTGSASNIIEKQKIDTRKALYLYKSGSCRVLNVSKIYSSSKVEFKSYCEKGDHLLVEAKDGICYLGHLLGKNEDLEVNNKYAKIIKTQPTLHQAKNRNGRNILVYTAERIDLKSIYEIEKTAWSKEMAATKATLTKRFNRNNKRFIVAYDYLTKKAIGFIYWVPCKKNEIDGSKQWSYFTNAGIEKREDAKYEYRYVVSISVHPDAPIDTGKILLEACKARSNTEHVVEFRYGIRINNFSKVNKAVEIAKRRLNTRNINDDSKFIIENGHL